MMECRRLWLPHLLGSFEVLERNFPRSGNFQVKLRNRFLTKVGSIT